MKIEDPKILCKGEVSYEARYKNGKITYLYVAPWVPVVVKQRLVQQIGYGDTKEEALEEAVRTTERTR